MWNFGHILQFNLVRKKKKQTALHSDSLKAVKSHIENIVMHAYIVS
jgi:hypothetical protein